VCCKILGLFGGGSERLIKFADSWFFAKPIEVGQNKMIAGGRALAGLGWSKALPIPMKLRIPDPIFNLYILDRLWMLRSKAKRATAQIYF